MDRIIVDQILDEIDYEFARKEPPESFPNLKRIPAERYLDQALFEEELNLFKNSWQFVGTVHELPEVGSYKVMDRWAAPQSLWSKARTDTSGASGTYVSTVVALWWRGRRVR